MSFFSSNKDKELLSKKSQFYVEFLGWMECRGLRGRKYTDPIIRELRRRQRKVEKPPKFTIQVTRKEIKITQELEEKKKRGIQKIKFPTIPARDVTYAAQAQGGADGPPEDVVACIYLGYMPRTNCSVHVHVYRFDEPATAATFMQLMNIIVKDNATRITEVELDLAERGEIEDPRVSLLSDDLLPPATDSATGSASSAYSEDDNQTLDSDEIEADLQSLNEVKPFDSVAEELKQRLKMRDGPLLLPPRDYDTISRARGNLKDINERRCLNLFVVGEGAVTVGPGGTPPLRRAGGRNGSGESGVDLASPSSDVGDVTQQFSQPPSSASGGEGLTSSSASSPKPAEDNFIYPPRQTPLSPRNSVKSGVSRASDPPRSPVTHVRQSSQSSVVSTHSSLSSGSGADNVVLYRGGESLAPSRSGSVKRETYSSNDAFLPPTDYHHSPDDDYARVVVRPKARGPLQRSASTEVDTGAAMLTRSMPAAVLHSEMALSGAGAQRAEEYYFNGQRRSQPLYGSSSQVNTRPLPAADDRRGNHYVR